MKVIRLREDCYVQPQAILILTAEQGLLTQAPPQVQEAWKKNSLEPNGFDSLTFIPAIKAALITEKDVMIYFADKDERDKQLVELVNQWRAE